MTEKNRMPIYYVLPDDETEGWRRVPKLGRIIPFGYEIDPEDPKWLNPIPLELDFIEKAKEHIKQYSYRVVAEWVSARTGRSISHVGLKKRIDHDKRRRTLLKIQRTFAREYEKVLAQLKDLEENKIGARRDSVGRKEGRKVTTRTL